MGLGPCFYQPTPVQTPGRPDFCPKSCTWNNSNLFAEIATEVHSLEFKTSVRAQKLTLEVFPTAVILLLPTISNWDMLAKVCPGTMRTRTLIFFGLK